MAAPAVVSRTFTAGTANNTATLNLPATIAAGDRLVAIVTVDSTSSAITSNPSDSTSDAWTTILASTTLIFDNIAIFEKIVADGDEDGGTLNVVHNGGSEGFAGCVIRISGSHASQATEDSTITSAEDVTSSDPPSLTASWGAEDNLFISWCWTDANMSGIAGPTGYTFGGVENTDWAQDGTGTAVPSLAVGSKGVTATATDDPDAWDSWATSDAASGVLVIRPAAAAVGMGGPLVGAGLVGHSLINRGLVR